MKKIIYVLMAALTMLVTFISCDKPEDLPSVSFTATDYGINMQLYVPAEVTNIQIIRQDLDTLESHVCLNINYNPSPSVGDNFDLTDYFVKSYTNYEYTVQFITNWDWYNPYRLTRTVTTGIGGVGLLTVFKTKPTYDSATNKFVNMELNPIGADGIEGFYTVNAAEKGTPNWLIDDGGINIHKLGDGTYIDISKLHDKLKDGIDGYTIRVIPVINSYEQGAWINYSGITSYYRDGQWY